MTKPQAFIEVIKTGPGTKIRDIGRKNYAEFGVPPSGPLDPKAVFWINHLLKNKEEDAVLEINQPGLKLQFHDSAIICLAGAKAEITINGKTTYSSGLQIIPEGSLLEVGKFELGSILYLGIQNGFQTPIRLGSRSYSLGITEKEFVKAGDTLPFIKQPTIIDYLSNSRVKWNQDYLKQEKIRAYPGPEFDLLRESQQEQLRTSYFSISNLKNGMAVQLEELVPNELGSIYTAPVFPGTVQLTHGGKLICLLSDAQVTGGYPRVLQIHEDDLGVLAQKKPKEKIQFQLIEDFL
ncbi:MAG: biotin-dependent carboxyltransferase family protein [Algoriphagus sp.]|uniref:5-oxoprolinase subunit C family protein n=1 Tax=Algoriphagus sp. TaxID=1872435 RepID=UPI00178F0942|nr:biotin-dependent carboxyltransferase family protein [Algoriphagus sp.]NVJ85661.1 biotin-dependent carboxyltransferase family protein [Algoriphagus sp.]